MLSLFYAHKLTTLFLALLIEEAGIPIPIPGDTLVALAGSQPPHTIGQALAVVSVSSLAVFLGSSALFAVVQRGGRPLLRKYGKYILLHQRRLAQMEQWFARRGRWTIIVGRLIPGLRIPTTIMAGISGIACADYALMAAIAAVIWSVFYYLLGSVLGRTAPLVLPLVADVLDEVPRWLLVLSVLILLASGGLGASLWKIRQARLRRLNRLNSLKQLRQVRHLRREPLQMSDE